MPRLLVTLGFLARRAQTFGAHNKKCFLAASVPSHYTNAMISFHTSSCHRSSARVYDSAVDAVKDIPGRGKILVGGELPVYFVNVLKSGGCKMKYGLLRKMFSPLVIGKSSSVRSIISTTGTEYGGNKTDSTVLTKDVPQPSSVRRPQSSSNVLAKKRTKSKGGSNGTIMDEYGYTYDQEESFPITAYAVCDEFDLKAMHKGLVAQGLYIPTVVSEDLSDVIHVSAKYPIGDEPREIFFFREGAVVFWNVPYLEIINVLKFLKEYEDESYGQEEIQDECEYMSYAHSDQGPTRLVRGKIFLGSESSNKLLEKYAFANALASSVKLGIWEATLEKYVEGIENITEALKRAEEIKLSRAEVMQKTGELFALRHQLNLNSDLLDTPDFYWERERLETLYQKTYDYLSIHRRTKVMNEKLSQCCELLDLISSHLTDQHHTRLEWMIIILIMIEVGFEILHLLERYELIHG